LDDRNLTRGFSLNYPGDYPSVTDEMLNYLFGRDLATDSYNEVQVTSEPWFCPHRNAKTSNDAERNPQSVEGFHGS